MTQENQDSRHKTAMKEKRKELKTIKDKKEKIFIDYNLKIQDLRERGLEIRELIQRARTEGDGGLDAILDKWQYVNDQILDQYPEGQYLTREELESFA